MELSVINIGNSKGIRLSKTMLEKYQIQDNKLLIDDESLEDRRMELNQYD
jgi:antitoxin MazE